MRRGKTAPDWRGEPWLGCRRAVWAGPQGARVQGDILPDDRRAPKPVATHGHRHPRALDTLVAAVARGESPESIHESYPSVELGDIYAVFTYCLRHRAGVNSYLASRAEQRAERRVEIEARFPPEGLRAKLPASPIEPRCP
ncbi:DUF433 domain-containing protein [Kribbia dieselivorans]|uniref:DUF433 domain-containing protein n=1 Tax=Kribbia dieselivorans TaxID=331526 RepID=UPI0009F8F35C